MKDELIAAVKRLKRQAGYNRTEEVLTMAGVVARPDLLNDWRQKRANVSVVEFLESLSPPFRGSEIRLVFDLALEFSTEELFSQRLFHLNDA